LNYRAWLTLSSALVACDTTPHKADPDPPRSTAVDLALPTEPAALASLLGSSPDSLLAAGLERYRNQAFDSAQAIWNVELKRTDVAKDAKAEARVRMWLGIVAWKLGDYKSARENAQASLALKRKLGMDDELSRSFNSLGLIAYNEGRSSDALEMYDSAVAAAERHDDAAGVARAAANIPLVKVELGRFTEARQDFDRALNANQVADDARTQANLLANIGMLEVRLGNPRRAITLLDSARRLYEDNDASGKANALGQLATAWMAVGELQRALGAVDSAIAIARSEGMQQELAANMEVLADLQLQAGNSRLALSTLHAADSIDATIGLATERGTNLRRSGMILSELGETAPAISMAERALDQHRRANAASEGILDRVQLARSLSRTDSRRAQAQMDSAEREAVATRNPAVIREAVFTAADLMVKRGDAAGALRKIGRPSTSDRDDWRIADLRAAALQKLARYDEAKVESQHAVNLVERERASLGVGPLRSGYLANRTRPYSRLIAIQLALDDTAAAFETAASLPGRTLAERLSGMDSPGQRLAQIARNEKLLMQTEELERQLVEARSDEASGERVRALEVEISRTRTAYESALATGARLPRGGMLGESRIKTHDIQAMLAPHQAMLLYLSGEDRLDIFVVSHKRLSYASSAISSRGLSQKVRFARESLQRLERNHATMAALSELRRILISPVEHDLGSATQLIVVPHAAISALPFAALWDAGRGKFLIEEKTITYSPTAAALTISSAARSRDLKLSVFAPDPMSLPGSRVEAASVARSSRESKMYIGSRSTKAAVRDALVRGDIVHIASHGSHNSQNPLFSQMTVASKSRAGSDGMLAVYEIMTMPVRSPLVFLSGCETGLGGEGDGVFSVASDEGSLAQAFLFAGASSVVATLWPVRDSEAAAIATDFYKRVQAGRTPWDALGDSQRAAISRGNHLTWAAYTISGVGSGGTRSLPMFARSLSESVSLTGSH
jgi:CHAT domain-containing protein/tetratricopeptide (TPR) repeat protein